MKRWILFFIFCFCMTGLFGCTSKKSIETVTVPEVTSQFEIDVLKAGKADSMILYTREHCVIIDCGERGDADKILEALQEKQIQSVDYLIITHFDKDHVGGAAEVVGSIKIENVLVPDYIGNNDEYTDFLNALQGKGIQANRLNSKVTVTLDDVVFTVYPPQRKDYEESDNDYSLVTAAYHGKNRFLFAGDAEEERLKEILDLGTFDWLKVPHHGRYNGVTAEFFSVIKPKYAVITDSKKEQADDQTQKELEKYGTQVYETKNGAVQCFSDGSDIIMLQE